MFEHRVTQHVFIWFIFNNYKFFDKVENHIKSKMMTLSDIFSMLLPSVDSLWLFNVSPVFFLYGTAIGRSWRAAEVDHVIALTSGLWAKRNIHRTLLRGIDSWALDTHHPTPKTWHFAKWLISSYWFVLMCVHWDLNKNLTLYEYT